MVKIGTPMTSVGKKAILCGSGELGKEVALELQRYGVEVIALDKYENAPAMQVAHRSYVLSMLDGERLREIIEAELTKLQNTRLTTRQLAMAKRQYIAQMTIATEGNEGYMLGVGRSLLVHGDVDTLEEAYKKINAVTASQIMEVANEIFTNNSTLIYR